jgi:hypothetical protein
VDFPRDLGGDYSTERMSFEDYESLKILTKRTFRRYGVLSVISRSSHGGMRQGIRELKEKAILRKVLLGWLGVLWVFLGSSLVLPWSLARERLGRYEER